MAESPEDTLYRHDHQLDDIERRVGSISTSMDLLRRQLVGKADRTDLDELTRSTRRSVADVTEHLEEAHRQLVDTEERLRAELDRRERAQRSEAERVTARVSALERYVRMAKGVPVADLDHDPELVTLAGVADRGAELRDDLLDDAAQARCHGARSAWTTWRDGYRAAVDGALTAAVAVADTEPRTPQREQALAAMWRHHREVSRLRELREATRAGAQDATQALAVDAATRAAHASELAAGEAAEHELRERLRARLTDAVGRDQLMPVWLHDRLGPYPQGDDGLWRDLAVDVMVHRATYDVSDTRRALGEPPARDDGSRAARQYRTLDRRLDRP